MIQLLIIAVSIYVIGQGVYRLNKGPTSEKETPEKAKRDGIIFTVVGVLLLLLGLSFGFIMGVI